MKHEFCILAVLGILIHFLMTVMNRKNRNTPFSLSYMITDSVNWVRLILAVASTIAILLMADDVAQMLHFTLSDGTPAKHLLAFFAGYFNHSLIKRLVSTFNKTKS